MGPPLFCALAGRRTQIRRCAEKAPGLSHCGKSGGFAVALKGTEITSVWDVTVPGYFQEVTDKMAAYVKEQRIDTIYATSEGIAGGLSNFDNYNPEIKEFYKN